MIYGLHKWYDVAMKTIKEEIEEFIFLSGTTCYRLAKEAGIPRSYLSRLTNGKQRSVFSHTADRLRFAMFAINPDVAASVLNNPCSPASHQ